MPADSSPEPGYWRNTRTPFLAEIMDCLSPLNEVREVYVQKSTQIGVTECAINLVGYHVDYWPCGMMFVMQDEATVKKTSKQKLGPTIKSTPALRDKISDRQGKLSRDNLYDKEFAGGFLQMTWASSASGLRSTSCPVVVADELDAWPRDSSREGDPLKLVRRRMQNFRNSKLFALSTPLSRGSSHIERARSHPNATDKRYLVPCPFCDHFQELKFEHLHFERRRMADGKYHVESAVYGCTGCGSAIEEKHKTQMLAKGKWVAQNEEADGSIQSYWINGLYSPYGWLSWRQIGQEFFDAQGDPNLMRVFTNTILAETFVDESSLAIEATDIPGIGEDYDCATQPLPEDGFILTMGVDVQDDRLEGEIKLWGEGDECWGVEYFISDGDPSDIESELSPWAAVVERLERRWKHPTAGDLRIVRTCIDSAGHHTSSVYAFVRPLLARQVWACKGASTPGKPPISRGRARDDQVPLITVGTEGLKDRVMARLKQTEPGPGFWHFPAKYDPIYFEQLTAEQRVESWSRGKPVTRWQCKPGRKRNEPFDIAVLNYVALLLLGEIDWPAVKNRKKSSVKPGESKGSKAQSQNRQGFVNSWRRGL